MVDTTELNVTKKDNLKNSLKDKNKNVENNTEFESCNVKRMIKSIRIESINEAKKIREDAKSEYEKIKMIECEIIKEEYNFNFEEKFKKLTNYSEMVESKLNFQFKQKVLVAKNLLIDKIEKSVIKILRSSTLDNNLIIETIEKLTLTDKDVSINLTDEDVDIKRNGLNLTDEDVDLKQKDYTLFCEKRFMETVKYYFSGNILEIPCESIGGIIIAKNDGTFICDNSYATRLNEIKNHRMNLITKSIFY